MFENCVLSKTFCLFVLLTILCSVRSAPQQFETFNFKVGIEYDHSLPMNGGSDRYRHRNNFDPFSVGVTVNAKKGYVITYLEVKAYVDEFGTVDFTIIRGQTGSRSMVFQLVSNRSDFLSYSYLSYGIREEEYKKITNVISLPIPTIPTNNAKMFNMNNFTFLMFTILYQFLSYS